MDEKRLTVRLRKYWEILRNMADMPDFQWLNTSSIEDLWPNCITLGLLQENSYKYIYMGPQIVELYGRDMTGQTLDRRMKQFPGNLVAENLDKVIAGRKPVDHEGHIVNGQGALLKYRACFLPFGNEARGITHVIAGISYRAF